MRSRASILAAGIAMILGTGCRLIAPHPAPTYELHQIELQEGFLHVTLKIPHRPSGRKPVVIGPLGDEEALRARGVATLEYRQNWSVLAQPGEANHPDARRAKPNRVGQWLLAAPRPGIVGRAYFQLIGFTARDTIPALLDWLEELPGIDHDRIAIAGSSTTGFIALEAMIAEPRLAAGVARVTCGDYRGFLRSSALALNDDPRWLPDGELILDPAYEAEIDAHQPIAYATALPPRPLLLIAGTADHAVPYACAKRTADRFAAAYADAGVPERFDFVPFDALGHDLGPEAASVTLAFWERWLLGHAPPGAEGSLPAPAKR